MRKASRFNDLVQARIEGLLPPKYISKLETKDIAIACGVQTSKILQPPTFSDNIVLPKFESVIKPVHESSSRGVLILSKYSHSKKKWFDEMRQSWFLESDIRRILANSKGDPQLCFVEEKIESFDRHGQIPKDVKCFVIGGEVRLVGIYDRNTQNTSYQFFQPTVKAKKVPPGGGAGWSAVGDGDIWVKESHRGFSDLPNPREMDEIEDAARRVYEYLGNPVFASIDFYQPDFLGEITMTPGLLYYGANARLSDQMERKLFDYGLIHLKQLGLENLSVKGEPPSKRYSGFTI